MSPSHGPLDRASKTAYGIRRVNLAWQLGHSEAADGSTHGK